MVLSDGFPVSLESILGRTCSNRQFLSCIHKLELRNRSFLNIPSHLTSACLQFSYIRVSINFLPCGEAKPTMEDFQKTLREATQKGSPNITAHCATASVVNKDGKLLSPAIEVDLNINQEKSSSNKHLGPHPSPTTLNPSPLTTSSQSPPVLSS